MARDMMRLRREVLNNTPHVEQASGAIATFETDMAAKLKEAVISFEPQQDLHGYDAPWPRGGGINVMPPAAAETKTVNGITVVSDGNGKYTITGTATADADVRFSIPAFTIPASTDRTFCIMNSAAKGTIGFLKGYTSIDTWSMTPANRVATSYSAMANKACDGVRFIFTSGTDVNMTVSPMFLAKDKATNVFVPYSNECPITGWSQAKVQASGKNMLAPIIYTGGSYNGTIGAVWNLQVASTQLTKNGDAYTIELGSWKSMTFYFPLKIGETVHLKAVFSATDMATTFGYLDKDFHLLTKYNETGPTITKNINYTGTEDYAYGYLLFAPRSSKQTITITSLQLERGSTASDYAAYTGTSVTIDLNGTRYGGMLNVLTGVLRVTHEVDIFDSSYNFSTWGVNYRKSGITGFYWYSTPLDLSTFKQCDVLPVTNSIWGGNAVGTWNNTTNPNSAYYIFCFPNTTLGIVDEDSSQTAISKLLTYLNDNPISVCKILADPFDVQLTPAQLRAIKGQNNIFADCGDVAVKYWKHGG